MTANWPTVPLGSVIQQRKEFVLIDDTETYKRCRVQLHAQGIVLRDQVVGGEVKTKKQQVCQAGEFLVAEIDAKVGGYGIVPAELDGAIVSSHYFLFQVDERQLEQGFLAYYIRTPAFFGQVSAQGSTNYAAIRPADVLSYKIPLPPLAEQRQIVAKIDGLATAILESKAVRNQAGVGCEQLCQAVIFNQAGGPRVLTPMRELVQRVESNVDVQPTECYHFAGVLCFGGGVFRGPQKMGAEFAYRRLTRLRAGQFVYPKLMAWEGALGVVPPDCEGLCVSPEFPVFDLDTSRIFPEVLDTYFRTPAVWPSLSSASTGTNVRRRRLNPEDFLRYRFPLPAMEIQLLLREVRVKVDALKALQAQTAAELDALMPSILDAAFSGRLTAGEVITVSTPAAAGESAAAPARKQTPFKDDAAIVCLLIDALARHDRSTDEFFCQKHAFVLKERGGLAVNSAFVRQAAGPWSQQLKRRAIYAGEKINWLRWAKSRLVPGPSFQKGLAHARALLGDKSGTVAAVVEDLAGFGRNGLERWTTVLKVVRDLEAEGESVTLSAIQREIDAWPGKRLKEAFTEESVEQTVRKMVRRGWIRVADAGQ